MIRIDHDLNTNAFYVHVTDLPVTRTEEVDSGTLVDLASDETVVGIEVVEASRPWPLSKILERFSFSESDADMLRAMFSFVPVEREEHRAAHTTGHLSEVTCAA